MPLRCIYRYRSRDPVLGVWWGICRDQLVCETNSRQAEQTGQPLEPCGTFVAAPTSLSLCHLLFFLSLTHTHTHTHTSPSTCLRPNSHFVSTTGRWWSSSVYMVRVRTCLETALLYGTPKTGETSVREEAGVNATPRIVLFPRLVFLLGHFCCHVCVSYLVCRSNIWKFRLFHRSWDFL